MKNDKINFKSFNVEIFLILTILFLLPFYFIKFKYSWISLNLVEILISLLFLFWFFNKEKKFSILNSQFSIPVNLIFTGLFLSIIANKNYYVGLGIIKGWFLLPIIFSVIFCDSLEKNEKLLGWSLAALFFGGALVSIEGIYYWFSGLLTFDGRLDIFYDSPNQLAMYLAPVFLIGFLRFDLSKLLRSNLKIRLHAICLLLITFNLYLTKSYGAWLAISLTLVAIFCLKYRKIWSKKYFFIVLIIFVAFITITGFEKFENIKNLGERSSLASRIMIWKSAVLMIKSNPLFGIGPGSFQSKYLEYQKYFPPYLEWAVPQPHNLYLAFWLESGIIGLAGFIWLMILFFRDNKRAIKNNRSYGTICFAIILYFLIHGLVDTTYWRNDMAVVFWIVITINFYLMEKPLFLRKNT
jgi:O-antigen ligase